MTNTESRRIGLRLPFSNTTLEPGYWRRLPRDVTVHVARLTRRRVETDPPSHIVEDIETGSRKLADAEVEAIVPAAIAPSSRCGVGYAQELTRWITAASPKPIKGWGRLSRDHMGAWHGT
jgi:maleate cis-trans isomerase